ncbi:short chain enoyl-CoA hydratase [Marinobacter daqiaonensis]|uniref:Short chain enoyl-CoA hydratase n=1 Tax=Marinobacter daqiaonensis TaxID=650891 RepID=A0A1I6I5V6_9GAMM|nr:enoyl-CoA hydratase [Marinobacter daqiaonensis]SFR62127.1 short chain enoyl-CoA hydratase [Marinobacter daqiaonensis]
MSESVLLERRDNGVALVTLNRPEAMNALSTELRQTLYGIMQEIRSDDTIRAVVVTGAGQKAFTAGLDLKELGTDTSGMKAATDRDPTSNPVTAIRSCGKPVVGAINGVAITGGFEVALACDILIASENARFADTHALVGIMPGWGLSQKLQRIIGQSRAKELSFTGRFLNAETAAQWGLVNRVVPADKLLDEALTLADDIAVIEPPFLAKYRHLMEHGYELAMDDALDYETLFSSIENGRVTPEDIERRRQAVTERGRARKG